jgi:prepilin-type N-terminal cleavage/methylation domain-containing protein
MKRQLIGHKGFSLIELLIVIGMLTVVMIAVYSLYDTHSKSAYVQEEVVDVQQNLRIAMDSISRDIRMAGMLIPLASTPVGNAGNDAGVNAGSGATDTITLNAASTTGQYGRIDNATPVIGATPMTFTLDTVDAVSTFNLGNNVRIISPPDRLEPAGTTGAEFQVQAMDLAPLVRTIQVTWASGDNPTGKTFNRGDMLAVALSNSPRPNTIGYFVTSGGPTCPANLFCLARATNVGTGVADTQVIATNITNLQFRYILDTNAETDAPANLSQIRAVRVTITGQTVATRVQSGGPKTKQITSVVKLRNR